MDNQAASPQNVFGYDWTRLRYAANFHGAGQKEEKYGKNCCRLDEFYLHGMISLMNHDAPVGAL
jgi:hypothetical protein